MSVICLNKLLNIAVRAMAKLLARDNPTEGQQIWHLLMHYKSHSSLFFLDLPAEKSLALRPWHYIVILCTDYAEKKLGNGRGGVAELGRGDWQEKRKLSD